MVIRMGSNPDDTSIIVTHVALANGAVMNRGSLINIHGEDSCGNYIIRDQA